MDRDGYDRVADTGAWVGLPGLDAGPVDHAWLDNGHGILSCVAGHRHAPDAVAVCPSYLRADVVDTISDELRASPDPPSPILLTRRRGARYRRVPSARRTGGYVPGVAGTFPLGVAEPRPFAGGSDTDDIERRTW